VDTRNTWVGGPLAVVTASNEGIGVSRRGERVNDSRKWGDRGGGPRLRRSPSNKNVTVAVRGVPKKRFGEETPSTGGSGLGKA